MLDNQGRTDFLVSLVAGDVLHLQQLEDFVNRRVFPRRLPVPAVENRPCTTGLMSFIFPLISGNTAFKALVYSSASSAGDSPTVAMVGITVGSGMDVGVDVGAGKGRRRWLRRRREGWRRCRRGLSRDCEGRCRSCRRLWRRRSGRTARHRQQQQRPNCQALARFHSGTP